MTMVYIYNKLSVFGTQKYEYCIIFYQYTHTVVR